MPAGCLELPRRLVRKQRKSVLVRQLKRKAAAAATDIGVAQSATAVAPPMARDGSGEGQAAAQRRWRRKGPLDALLKRLDLESVEALGEAVRSRGAVRTACVFVDRDAAAAAAVAASDGRATSDPTWLCCRAWRWPDLHDRAALRPLPLCTASSPPSDEKGSRCVNPYHWSRVLLCSDGSPVSRREQDVDDPADSGFSGSGGSGRLDSASSTNSWIQQQRQQDGWCQVAYWELSQRIGPLLRVSSSSIDIFHESPQHGCGGLSLQALWEAASRQQDTTAVQQACATDERKQQQQQYSDDGSSSCTGSGRQHLLRNKIGLGVSLQHDDDGAVWVHNRSDIAAFVSSHFLDLTRAGTGKSPRAKDFSGALKLMPGYCIKVDDGCARYGCNSFGSHTGTKTGSPADGPTDPRSIHLSFAKGWGPGYTRQSITACSCWLEILLHG